MYITCVHIQTTAILSDRSDQELRMSPVFTPGQLPSISDRRDEELCTSPVVTPGQLPSSLIDVTKLRTSPVFTPGQLPSSLIYVTKSYVRHLCSHPDNCHPL